ncbi:hypothetical protein GQ457_06G008740 [Hibiscus cannabinus]
MFYVVDIFTKVKKLHNFSLKGKFIFSPTKQASSLNLSRADGLWFSGDRMHSMMALHSMMNCVFMNGFGLQMSSYA